LEGNDLGETLNLRVKNIEVVKELKSLLIKYINDDRSTTGIAQKNDSIDFEWKQIDFMK